MAAEKTKEMNETKKNNAQAKGASECSCSNESDDVLKELQACKLSVKEWQEKYARLSADLENFRRRTFKEQKEWAQMAQSDLLVQLLAITDDFDRAMEHQETESADEIKSWIDGITMIHKGFAEFLSKAGVKEVSYETFDPYYHEALLQVDSKEHKSGQIVQVMQKGYKLNDRVLRPAKVSVAK